MPVTVPEIISTVATAADDEDQVPPATELTKVVVVPLHSVVVPVTADGGRLAVTGMVARAVPQAVVTLYVIMTVPGVKALTTPEGDMLAIAGLLLLHMPPLAVDDIVMGMPIHATDGP